MRSRATPRFWAAYRELPPEIRDLAQKAYRLFRENPDTGAREHHLSGDDGRGGPAAASVSRVVIGADFFLAFSPERVDPGNQRFTTANIPKVVGGVTRACTELAGGLYRHVTGSVFKASSPRVAETAKLLENTFRSVNIALANEFALACRKIGVDPLGSHRGRRGDAVRLLAAPSLPAAFPEHGALVYRS